MKKSQTKSGLFQLEKLVSRKTLSKLHYKSLLKRVHNKLCRLHKILKDFTVSLKMIDAIDKKQMYDSVIMWIENASEE